MKPLTEDLIKKHLGDKVEKKGKKWKVKAPSGMEFTITDSLIDPGKYKDRDYRLKHGVDDEAATQDTFDALRLSRELWGDDLGIYETPGLTKEDEDVFMTWARENGFSLRKADDTPLWKKRFGDDAVAKKGWIKGIGCPTLTISKPDGSFARFGGGGRIEEVRGDLWAEALHYSKELTGAVRICGTESHVQTGLAHASSLKIDDAIPEVFPEATCAVMGIFSGVVGFGGSFILLPTGQACFVGLVSSFTILAVLAFAASGSLKKKALDDGLKLKNSMPAVHGNRGASSEDLEKGGWIERL